MSSQKQLNKSKVWFNLVQYYNNKNQQNENARLLKKSLKLRKLNFGKRIYNFLSSKFLKQKSDSKNDDADVFINNNVSVCRDLFLVAFPYICILDWFP